MNLLDVLILSVVEGITEFLPVSSTGHLVLTASALRLPQTEFLKTFEIVIQLGAILSILILYGKILIRERRLLILLVAGFLPSALAGLILYDFIKDHLIGNPLIPVVMLFTGGIILILFEKYRKGGDDKLTYQALSLKKAILIGIFQIFSIVPGVSRSAATIIGGMTAGMDKKNAAEFSFLLAVPTMIGASALDLVESEFRFGQEELLLLFAGVVLSFLSATFAVRFLMKFLQKHSFTAFGIYRIALAVIYYLVFIR